MGNGGFDGITVKVMSVVSPGVVGGGAKRMFVNTSVNVFGLDNLSLAWLLIEN